MEIFLLSGESKKYWDVYNTLNKRVILAFYRDNITIPNMKLKQLETSMEEIEEKILS